MHMIAIGWLWVAFMMAITEKSLVAGVLTFVFYGLLPCAILLYLLNKQAGKRRSLMNKRRERERLQETGGTGEPIDGPAAGTEPAAPAGSQTPPA